MAVPDLSRGVMWQSGSAASANIAGPFCGLGQGGFLFTLDDFFFLTTVDGWIDRVSVGVNANARTKGTSFTLRDNLGNEYGGSAGIGAGQTGLRVSSGAPSFAPAGTLLRGYQQTLAYIEWIEFESFGFRFTPADGVSSISTFEANNSFYPDNPYFGILGQPFYVAVESADTVDYRVGASAAGATAQKIRLEVFTNTLISSARIYLQVNGADSGLYVQINPGETGWLISSGLLDPLLSTALVLDDRIRYRIDYAEGETGYFHFKSIALDLVTTDRTWFGGLGQQGRTVSGVRDFVLCGLNNFGSTLDGSLLTAALVLKYLGIYIADNDFGGGTLEVLVDGVPSGMVVTIAPGALGHQFTTGPLAIPSGSTIGLRLTTDGPLTYSVIDWSGLGGSVISEGEIGPLAWWHFARRVA